MAGYTRLYVRDANLEKGSISNLVSRGDVMDYGEAEVT